MGGILRDIIAMGARPIALLDALRFGAPDDHFSRAVGGVGTYGNCVGVPNVGAQTARDLAAHFETLERLMGAGEPDLMAVAGVGPAVAPAIAAFFRRANTRRVIGLLLERGVTMAAPPKKNAGPLAGKTVVFTGGLESLSRPAAEELVRRRDGRTSGSVSQATDFVVAGSDPG